MDQAHKETDRLIDDLEKKIKETYETASKEAQEKLDKYLESFKKKDEAKLALVREGKMTEEEYKKWRTGQILIGQRWDEMSKGLAQDFTNADKIAQSISQGYMEDAYALNHNYATFEVEKGSLVDTSYTLYDRDTVERLIKNDPDLLPSLNPEGKTAQAIREGRLIKWNQQKITGAVTQSILQGESINKMATRLQSVAEMDRNASIRNARTAMTGAQNAGRQAGYERAQEMGIELEKQWLAVLDGRTRHEHRQLDGVHVPIDEPFENDFGKIMFPGDPSADPANVYNCRCTMVTVRAKIAKEREEWFENRHNDALGDMSYKDWKQMHAEEKKQDNAFASNIEYSDALMQSKYDETREIINNLVNEYDTRLKSVSTGAEKSAGDVNITGETMRINTTNPDTAIHEFAHTLANTDADKYGLTDDKEFWKEIKSVRRKYMKDVQYDTSKWISSYEHSSGQVDEFLAEAFTQAKMTEMGLPLPDKYGDDLTYSQQVLEIVDEYFKRKKI